MTAPNDHPPAPTRNPAISSVARRDFLRGLGLSSVGVAFGGGRLFGQETLAPEVLYARHVPADKGLDPEWIRSLYKRGHVLDAAISYHRDEVDLEVIGMPVGGIGCGTVYLSGDGRLWIWDIFNQHHEGVVANKTAKNPEGTENIEKSSPRERDGANFLSPPRVTDHRNGVDAGFSLEYDGKHRALDLTGWDQVRFTGRWPVGVIDYASEKCPLKVRLEAWTPFIPLNLKDSSLPVTVLEYTVENPTTQPAKVVLRGHLNNPAGQFSGLEAMRVTEAFEGDGVRGLHQRLQPAEQAAALAQPDAGSMAIAALAAEVEAVPEEGTLSVTGTVPAGGRRTFRFAVSWHFPNIPREVGEKGEKGLKRHYVNDFADAADVVRHFAKRRDHLSKLTRLWVETWNDSTLPQWLLDRTILTTNTLQTTNCYLFEDGRFWAWEGVGCCPGTCGHVWQYAQGHARLFPEIERRLREKTDYAVALKNNGEIRFRGTRNGISAMDSQTSYVLRTLRDHQLSDDPEYLARVWEPTKKAIRYLIEFDRADPRGGLDGLLDGRQHNTLDAEWYGKVHVLCSMYLASLRAAEVLAGRMEDNELAREVRGIYEKGRSNIKKLYNGEFYEQIEDPAHLNAIGVGKGCYIDQVMGQYWANQVGLGRIYEADDQKSALRALWKYNFVPEYGAFRKAFPRGRHYAIAGDSGLLMCTWPKGGLRDGFTKHWQYAYFNEFMTGFEYQAAAHMVAEGDKDLVEHGLAITRAIHDRYSATRGRNPYNEIECSDHYARAASSYAVFLALCGFEFDQSRGRLAFAPFVPEGQKHFRAPFTTSKAWGTYEQNGGTASIRVVQGELEIKELDLALFGDRKPKAVLNGEPVDGVLTLKAGDRLELS